MSKNITKNLIYHCIKVLGPDGNLMFLCGQDKIDWYLSRRLAEPTQDSSTFRLLFSPKGNGSANDPFCLLERENKCVVCGVETNLSKHHVVPYCYRMHFPSHLKEHSHYDILAVCRKCHDEYEEKYSIKLRKNLEKQYDAPLHGKTNTRKENGLAKASKMAYALDKYRDLMPESRRLEITSFLSDFYGKDISEIDIQNIIKEASPISKDSSYKTHGEVVVSQIDDIQLFIEMWRRDFVENMKPMFLPKFWTIDYKKPRALEYNS